MIAIRLYIHIIYNNHRRNLPLFEYTTLCSQTEIKIYEQI